MNEDGQGNAEEFPRNFSGAVAESNYRYSINLVCNLLITTQFTRGTPDYHRLVSRLVNQDWQTSAWHSRCPSYSTALSHSF